MFDYTKTLFHKTVDDFYRIANVFTICTQIIYIGYLVYATIASTGIFITNLIMLIISSAYFIFFCVALSYEKLKKNKRIRKYIKSYYKLAKHLIQLVVISVSVYNLVSSTTSDVITIPMLVTAVMIFTFIIQVILEAICAILSARVNLFIEAFKADMEPLKKPIDTVNGLINRIKGNEPEEKSEPSRARRLLDTIVHKKKNADKKISVTCEDETRKAHK